MAVKKARLVVRDKTPKPKLHHVEAAEAIEAAFDVAEPPKKKAEAEQYVREALAIAKIRGSAVKAAAQADLPWPTPKGPAKAKAATPKQRVFIVTYQVRKKPHVALTGPVTWLAGAIDYGALRRARRNEILFEMFIGWERARHASFASAARTGAKKNETKLSKTFEDVELVDALQLKKRKYQVFVGQKQGGWYYVTDNGRQFGFDSGEPSTLHPLCYYLGLEFEAYGNPLARLRMKL